MTQDDRSDGPARLALNTALGLVATWLAWLIAVHFFSNDLSDFDLHYFGGVLERHGISYTDVTALVHRAQQQHSTVNANGIYGTPSLVALVFKPLALLSLREARDLWACLVIVLVTFGVRKATIGIAKWYGWLALIVLSPAMLETFSLGNPASLTFALLAYTFGALRQKQNSRAAVALGIAIALKAYPAFLLIVFVQARRWKALAVSLATSGVLVAVTIPLLGLHNSQLAFRVMLHVAGDVDPYRHNASIPAMLLHLTNSAVIAKCVGVGLLVACAVYIARIKAPSHHVMAVACLIMLMGQSISWRMYFTIAVFGLLCLKDLNLPRPTQYVAWTGGVLALGYGTYPLPNVPELLSFMHTLGAAMLLSVLVGAIPRPRESPAETVPTVPAMSTT